MIKTVTTWLRLIWNCFATFFPKLLFFSCLDEFALFTEGSERPKIETRSSKTKETVS